MRYSEAFIQTLRETPAEASGEKSAEASPGVGWLARAGYLQAGAASGRVWLPLGCRVLARIAALARAELESLGAQEVRFAAHLLAQPLAAMAELARRQVHSYRQLPRLLIAGQPAAALHAFGLDSEAGSRTARADALLQVFRRLLARCGVEAKETGMQADWDGVGQDVRELYAAGGGTEELAVCPSCGYQEDLLAAAWRKPAPVSEPPLPLEPVETPGATSIAALAGFLGIPAARTAKAVLLWADRLVLVVVRGDQEASAEKLARRLGAEGLRPATEEEIRSAGAVPGYASPIGLRPAGRRPEGKRGFLVAADDLAAASANLVAGANREGWHVRNVNHGRDYTADVTADFAAAPPGAACARCGSPLQELPAVRVARLSRLGADWSERQGLRFLDRGGRPQPVLVTAARLDLERLLAAAAEACHDGQGLVWPAAIAPFDVHLVALKGVREAADRLHEELTAAGLAVLYDDRGESPGVTFTDADLIGLPLRLTLSARALADQGVELKVRRTGERRVIPRVALISTLGEELKSN